MSDKIVLESTSGGLGWVYDLWRLAAQASTEPAFIGWDMAQPGSERTALTCPGCSTTHLWRPRESAPKRCRGCGLYFHDAILRP